MNTENHVHIPTDNLYKFVAIFAMILIPTLLASLFGLLATVGGEYDAKVLWNAVAKSEFPNHSIAPPPLPVDQAAKPAPDVPIPLPPDEDEPNFELQVIVWAVRAGLGVIAFLFFTSMLGFLLWYTRLQRHRDRIIRAEAMSSEYALKAMLAGKAPLRRILQGTENG